MNLALTNVEDAEIIEHDMFANFGLVSQDTVQGIALNMVEHYRGKVTGGYVQVTKRELKLAKENGYPSEWRRSHDIAGSEIIVRPGRKVDNKYETGDILLPDAIRVVQKTFSRGLNPMAHIHIWYQDGQLIDCVKYDVTRGVAEMQAGVSPEFDDMTLEERQANALEEKDIGKVAWLIRDEDKPLLLQATLQLTPELGFAAAKRAALDMIKKARGIGVLRADETIKVPKGRSKNWVAEKRAMTDAIRRGLGEMPPAQVAHYASGQALLRKEDLTTLASPDYQAVAGLPAENQQYYLDAARVTQEIKNTLPEELHQAAQRNINLMRGRNGDDDPLDLASPEEEPEPASIEEEAAEEDASPAPDLAQLRQDLLTEAAGNPRQGYATEKQIGLVTGKLEEVFASEDAPAKAKAVLAWLFDTEQSVKQLKFGQAHVLLKRLLLNRDDETGDYPLNQEFAPVVKEIYRQTQAEAG